jgi:hypothetical protein
MQLLTLPKLAARSGWPESRVRRMVARGCFPTSASMVGFFAGNRH